jgi:nucleoside phosphorylase
MKLRDGDKYFDCLAILDKLYRSPTSATLADARSDRWDLLWKDLQEKSSNLDATVRKKLLNAALASRLPVGLAPTEWSSFLNEAEDLNGKIAADAMIFCVIEEEFNATLSAFGVNQRKRKFTKSITGHKFYQIRIRSAHCGDISLWIGLIGEARNVVCANFCRDIFERFVVRHCCILVGIAGGNKEKVKLGDVVAAEEVIDIEGGRVEPRITKPRHKPYTLSPRIQPMIEGFNPGRWKWLAGKEKGLDLLKETGAHVSISGAKRNPSYKLGIVLAGEKLRRDGKLPAMAKRFGDKILAVEMEGSGFAASCRQKSVSWAIFRGISDYGDMKKRDEWQPIAAFHAALAAKAFIVDELRPTEDVQF